MASFFYINSFRTNKKGILITKSIINKSENSFKVDTPKFLYKISFRFARVSLKICHNRNTKSSFEEIISPTLNFRNENNILIIKDHIINGL